MPNHGLGPEPRFSQRPRSLYAVDPVDEEHLSALFNEAWFAVAQRSWREAEEMLLEFLELAPDDGEALVLLAKVHVARGNLSSALGALNAARDVGHPVDEKLRQAIKRRLGASLPPIDPDGDMTPSAPPPGIKDAVAARHTSFVLRQDNEGLHEKVASLEKEVRRWIFATMGVCVTATALVTWALVPPLPGDRPQSQAMLAPWYPPRTEIFRPAVEPVTPLDEIANGIIPQISEVLDVRVEDGTAVASGELADYRERDAIEQAWLEQPDIDRVDWSKVLVASRSVGGRIMVQPGDSLSEIAKRYYGDARRISPIKRRNGLKSNDLKPGQFLVIPPLGDQ